MGDTSIEWTDKTYSPIRARVKEDALEIALARGWMDLLPIVTRMRGHVGPHCEMCSPGCNHCYSLTNNGRCLPKNGTGLPFDKRSRELVDIFVDEKILMQPLRWKQPKKIFVENQSDLFGEWVPSEMIDRVFAVMALCPQHTFQILTKRPERMREYITAPFVSNRVLDQMVALTPDRGVWGWPGWDEAMKGVWLGVSAENQKYADERIHHLLRTPAAVRFISYEPALGPIDPTSVKCIGAGRMDALSGRYHETDSAGDGLDWVIVGGESGPGARPFDVKWARDMIEQCEAAGVACFVKQLGAKPFQQPDMADPLGKYNLLLDARKGGNTEEWPEDLRVRQFPVV